MPTSFIVLFLSFPFSSERLLPLTDGSLDVTEKRTAMVT